MFWNWSDGGGQRFSKCSENQKVPNYPRGGGVNLNWDKFPNFPVFFLMASLNISVWVSNNISHCLHEYKNMLHACKCSSVANPWIQQKVNSSAFGARLAQAAPSVLITNLWNITRQMFCVRSVKSINRGARQHSPQLPAGSWRSSAQIFHLSPKIEARQILKVAGNPPSLPGWQVFN